MKAEISIYVLIAILLIHWIADFILQTHEQSVNKSKSNYHLTMHVFTYSSVWFVCCCFYVWFNYVTYADGTYTMDTKGRLFIILFPTITFVCHWITDYLTSRLNTYLYKKGDIHNFFVSVGFDQILHYVQLILTLQLLS